MSLYLKTKKILQDNFNISLYVNNTPWGVSFKNDIRKFFPNWEPNTIFDIGANIGQTALTYHKLWPKAKIYSFEPIPSTYKKLKENTNNNGRISPYQLAFGSKEGNVIMNEGKNSLLSSIEDISDQDIKNKIEVDITTINSFCTAKKIRKINLLKIDTEGHDLEVVKGGGSMCENSNIDFMLLEFGIKSGKGKIALSDLVNGLSKYQMSCIGIYDQEIWKQRKIYYGNALFISDKLLQTINS